MVSLAEKTALIGQIKENLQEQIDILEAEITDIVASRDSASKSSAGDKYETGRAMMQLAQDQSKKQLTQSRNMLAQVLMLNPEKPMKEGNPGALIDTNQGKFFIAVGLGKLKTSHGEYVCVSLSSPVGQILRSKKEKEAFLFMGKQYVINMII